MHGADEGNYSNDCVFTQVRRPELITWDHISYPNFQVAGSSKEASKGETRVTFKMIFSCVEECNKAKAYAPSKKDDILTVLKPCSDR